MENLILFFIAFAFMEFVAWFSHKYIMHGFLWRWHKDHHMNDIKRINDDPLVKKGFEKNDLFFLIYAIPAIVLMITGFALANYSLVYIAAGITLYGIVYFILHDGLYHQRIPLKFLERKNYRYLKALLKAHHAHHKPQTSADFESYGLLIFPKRFFKD